MHCLRACACTTAVWDDWTGSHSACVCVLVLSPKRGHYRQETPNVRWPTRPSEDISLSSEILPRRQFIVILVHRTRPCCVLITVFFVCCVCVWKVSEMSGWGLTNLVDPDIETFGNTISVNIAPGDVIDDNDAVFWIAPQIYRGNKVFLSLSFYNYVSVCLAGLLSLRWF